MRSPAPCGNASARTLASYRLLADGSIVVGAGRLQFETGLQHEYRNGADGAVRTLFVPTLVRLGITGSLEARIEGTTYTLVKSADTNPGAGRSEGVEPVSIGLKYHVVDADGARRPSVAVIGRVFPASGSRGFRTNPCHWRLRLAADWDFAPQ